MTSSAFDIGISGMRAASAQLNATAANVANVSTSDYQPVDVAFREARAGDQPAGVGYDYVTAQSFVSPTRPFLGGVDLATEMVDMMSARMQFQASAMTVRAAVDMRRTLMDTFA